MNAHRKRTEHHTSEDPRSEEEPEPKVETSGEEATALTNGNGNGNGRKTMGDWIFAISGPLAVALTLAIGTRGCDADKKIALNEQAIENVRENYGASVRDLRVQLERFENKLDEVRIRLGGDKR